ncbi:MAG: restriction endonuclease subunit S [Microcystaceae cyanobacterium]
MIQSHQSASFKSSPLGLIPVDWDVVKLNEVIDHVSGGGTPSRFVPSYWNGSISWASVKDFTDDNKWLNETEETISIMGLNNSASNLIPPNVPVICTRMAVGRIAITTKNIAINQDLKALYVNNNITEKYLLLILSFFRYKVEAMAIGSTVKGINIDQLLTLEIPLPPLPEQKRIAEILDTLDETIQKTEQLIEKLQKIKAGLLHDLLTRGLDKNGNLRNPETHPEHFKDSALGLIPKEWEVEKLGEICLIIVDCPHTTPNFLNEGVLVARTSNIKDGVFCQDAASYVSYREYKERIFRAEPQPNDIIFTREAPVGEAFVIPQNMIICLGQRTMLLRPNPLKSNPYYIISQIYSGSIQTRIKQLVGGTTNPHLNVAEVRDFTLPVPKIEEQQEIAKILESHNNRIRTEKAYLEKLKKQKQGLMQDLLTGKVRV